MKISGSYNPYSINNTGTTSKKSGSKDKVQDYYEKLCKKFPQINFNTNGGSLPCNRNKVTVNLSQDCLEKMANDPEFAKQIEWNLSGEAAANSLVYGWAQRDGVVLGGRTVTYDANGNRVSSCGGMRTANSGNNNTQGIQKKYKEAEERWIKARKKREEREKLEKKREEKSAKEDIIAGKLAKKSEMLVDSKVDLTVSFATKDIQSLSVRLSDSIGEVIVGGTGGFDVKA